MLFKFAKRKHVLDAECTKDSYAEQSGLLQNDRVYDFSKITSMKNGALAFCNGERILFADCAGKSWHEKCVAERDICAAPPYFLFFTEPARTKIIFNSKGLFSKNRNCKNFLCLQNFITDSGYNSMDLS